MLARKHKTRQHHKSKVQRFFHPKVETGWKADMPMDKRRRLMLRAHGGDYLASGRAMTALANVQKRINPEVAKKAHADAEYFYKIHEKTGK